jgi:hypothetical protein
MKQLFKLLMMITVVLLLSPGLVFANNMKCQQNHYYNGYQHKYSRPSYRYYDYNYDTSEFGDEVDNACVDVCIDTTHTLNQCTRACYY